VNPMRKQLIRQIEQARRRFGRRYRDLPARPFTAGQRKLQRKHGSPVKFASGLTLCIGEISECEAELAIEKYLEQWRAA
jgi:hypothetical protein